MKIIKKYSFLLLLPMLLTACKDLERFPFNSIAEEQSFLSADDAQKWDNGIYSFFRGRQYDIYMFTTDVQGDQLNATLDYGNRNGAPHRWDFTSGDYSIRDVWAGYYNSLDNVNLILANIDNIDPENSDGQAVINKTKGDAFFARAYYYQELMFRYAKPYSPSTASSDPGVPLVLKSDISLRPSRATEKEVYEQILSDLDSAGILLDGRAGEPGAQYFNEDVVLAQLARTKLYMQDWEGAETAADKLIHSGTYRLIDNEADFVRMWRDDYPQEDIFQCFVSNSNGETPNTNSIYLGYSVSTNQFTPDFVPSRWVVDAYSDKDIRKNVYFTDTGTVYIQGSIRPGVYLVNKYPGNPELWTGASTNYRQAPKVFRIAEMYLISAEAAANQKKDEKALGTLNELRVARGLPKLSGITGTQLMDSIKMGRFRELAFEGFRLNDLERWHEGFTRHDPQDPDMLQSGADFYTKHVEPDADKFVWAIPLRDMTVNKNLKGEQNPGW